jgi:hypothetical protein
MGIGAGQSSVAITPPAFGSRLPAHLLQEHNKVVDILSWLVV